MAKTIIEELVTVLGYEYNPKELKKFNDGAKQAATRAKEMALAVTGTGIAALTAIIGFNSLTASQEKQAEQIGLSGQSFREWAGIVNDAGYQADILTDLIEEMNNKIGESKGLEGPINSVKDSFQILKLEFNDIKNLKPEEQFNKIASAIVNLQDKQAAVSAADILLGGEANKFFSALRARGVGVEEALEQQRELILLTQEEAEAAKVWSSQIDGLKRIFVSAFQSMSSIGSEYIGNIDDIRLNFSKWFKENKEDIRKFIDSSVKNMSLFISGLTNLVEFLWKTRSVILALAAAWATYFALQKTMVAFQFFKYLFSITKAIKGLTLAQWLLNIAMLANPITIIAAGVGLLIGAFVLVRQNLEAIKNTWNTFKKAFGFGGEEITGDFNMNQTPGSMFAKPTSSTATSLTNQINNNNINQNNSILVKSDNPTAVSNNINRSLKRWSTQSQLNLSTGII
jgi:hypothetical protein